MESSRQNDLLLQYDLEDIYVDSSNKEDSITGNIKKQRSIFYSIIHQSILYELLSNLIGSLLLYYDFILH